MNHTSDLRPNSVSTDRLRSSVRRGLPLAVLALLGLGTTGCYRASGLQRTSVAAEAMPEQGGDRVDGLKSMAGPGDYYLGNDFIQVAIDGTRFGDSAQKPIAGAAAGGSIVDAGYLSLNTSYQRVNMPADSLERLTPVVNQDPDLEIVFDTFQPDSSREPATLTMTGRILDAGHKLVGASWDAQGRVLGVKVQHTLSLAKLDRFIGISTTIVNESGAPVAVRSVGDFLSQTSGGYRFAIPAGVRVDGSVLPKPWGIEISGSDFGSPIATAVQSPSVVLLATEPSAGTVDAHASLGLMSVDAPTCMVTSDPQSVLDGAVQPLDKPVFPRRLVVGSLPLPPAGLAPGASLTYNRRLYIAGGLSVASGTPNSSSYLFNLMALAKFNTTDGLWPQDLGSLSFGLAGSAVKQGPLPTEVRLERIMGGTVDHPLWVPERVEWLEPNEIISSQSSLSGSAVVDFLQPGTYRLVISNALGTQVKDQAVNASGYLRPLLSEPMVVTGKSSFSIGGTDYLCPEAAAIVSDSGAIVRNVYSMHFFDARQGNAPVGNMQPLRITLKGTGGTPDPWMRRSRTLATMYNALTKDVSIYSTAASPGQNQFRAGNEMFGTGFSSYVQTRYFWLANGSATGEVDEGGNPVVNGGTYRAYATRGPLSNLETKNLLSYDGQGDTSHSFIIWPKALPSGWTSFDLPGPSQATGGGFLPTEKLTSALAEAVSVVGDTEIDLGVDADAVYNAYHAEFNGAGFLATQLSAINNEPYVVGARSSVLPGYGEVTSLFTPKATRYRFKGAIQPDGWSLADFITQARGAYTIVHRPRGPQGLFTLTGFDPLTPVGQGANAWWSGGGSYAAGATNGGFDAIELLRAEGFSATNPDPWFQEFKQVRADWFALLNQQTPAAFTKGLGLSAARFSRDTPVGLARTYLKASPVLTNPPTAGTVPPTPLIQDLSSVESALKSGAAVASTGPLLDVKIGTAGPGGLVAGPVATASLSIGLFKSDWMPVDEVRVVLNGQVVATYGMSDFTPSSSDAWLYTKTVQIPMPVTGTGAWVVVEAGVPLSQTGAYAVGTPWHDIMRGIYPIAVTNPIFIDVTGHGYTHP